MSGPLKPFSIWQYSVVTMSLHGSLLVLLRLVVPNCWKNQIDAGLGSNALVFLAMVFLNGFPEWAFHRYTLHTILARWLQTLAEKHRRHHWLTRVSYYRDSSATTYELKSEFPIEKEEQYESQAFPWWALIAFWALFTPIFVGLQLCFPRVPFLLDGYSAVTFSLYMYEVVHSIAHRPESWWIPRLKNPYVGFIWRFIWRKVVVHHFVHHLHPEVDLGVSKFLGVFAVADWVLGTLYLPKAIFPLGKPVNPKDLAPPPPRRIVQLFDNWFGERERQILKLKQGTSHVL